MSEQWVLQASVKIGSGYDAHMVNVRADNPDQFNQIAGWVTANAATVVNMAHALNSVPPTLAANIQPGSVQVVTDAPQGAPQQAVQGWQQQPQQAPQNVAQNPWGAPPDTPPPFAQQAPQQAGPTCQHGPMVHRSGEKNGRTWSGWFCPTPKGTPGQCEPRFGKG